MKYIFNFKSLLCRAEWYRGVQMNTKNVANRGDCWCGKCEGKRQCGMNEWLRRLWFINILYAKDVRSGRREDRINWHLLFVGIMIYDWRWPSNFSNMQRIILIVCRTLISQTLWTSEMNFSNCWTWSVTDTNKIDLNPSLLRISFFSIVLFSFSLLLACSIDTHSPMVDANLFVYLQNEQFIWIKFQLNLMAGRRMCDTNTCYTALNNQQQYYQHPTH